MAYEEKFMKKALALLLLACLLPTLTFSVAAAIVAADTAAKTALVDLIELRLARGMCGKSYMLLTGEIAAVEAAIERAKQGAGEGGMFLDSAIIPRPDKKFWQNIL